MEEEDYLALVRVPRSGQPTPSADPSATRARANVALSIADGVNPDQIARGNRLFPGDSITNIVARQLNPQEQERRSQINGAVRSPTITRAFQDPYRAGLMRDDTDVLGEMDDFFGPLRPPPREQEGISPSAYPTLRGLGGAAFFADALAQGFRRGRVEATTTVNDFNIALQAVNRPLTRLERNQLELSRATRQALERRREELSVAPWAVEIVGSAFGEISYSLQQAPLPVAVGATVGGILGGGAALVAGQLGPQVALPEEVLTVPAGTFAGARAGAGAGFNLQLLFDGFRQETGAAFSEYSEMRLSDGTRIDEQTALGAALVTGSVNGAIEAIADRLLLDAAIPGLNRLTSRQGKEVVDRLLQTDAGRSILRRVAERSAGAATVGGFTEFVQETVSIVVGETTLASAEGLDPMTALGVGTGEAFRQSGLARSGMAALEGAIGSAGVVGATQTVLAPIESYILDQQRRQQQAWAQTATGRINLVERAIETAGRTRLVDRDRGELARFVNEATEESPVSTIYVSLADAAQLAQEQNTTVEDIVRRMGGTAETIAAAEASGFAMEIPIGDFVASVSKTDLASAAVQIIKTNPLLYTRRELEVLATEGQEQAIAVAERLAAAAQNDVELQAGVLDVQAELERAIEPVRAQLAAAIEPVVGETGAAQQLGRASAIPYAKIAAEGYGVIAQVLGITPREAMTRYPLRIGEMQVGPNLGQPIEEGAPVEGGPIVRAVTREIPVLPEFGTPEWTAMVQAAQDKQSRGEALTTNERALINMGREDAAELARILDRIRNGQELTPASQRFLRERGYDPVTGQRVQDETLGQTVRLRMGAETLARFGLDPNKKYKTREVATALEARARKKHGTIADDDFSAEASKKIQDFMIDEIMFEVDLAKQTPSKSAVGWYSEKFQRALDNLATKFPELLDETAFSNPAAPPGVKILATPQNARNFLTALIAITSDGAKVKDNLRFAWALYSVFREDGKLPTSVTFGGERNTSMDININNLQALLDQQGPADMHAWLLDKDTVSNLRKRAIAAGHKFNVAYKADMQLPQAALIFGPKLGAFYANLMGDTGYLTMDRWWSRTFNRYRGTLLAKPTREGLERFKRLVTEDRKLNEPPETMTDDEALALTVDYVQSYKAKKFKNGTEIEKAANTLYKAAFEQLEDQPFNASDREFMINTTLAVQKRLRRRGVIMTVADIQAVLWYYEKRLYGVLGARQTADISYEDIALAQAGSNQSPRDVISGRSVSQTVGDGEQSLDLDEDLGTVDGDPEDVADDADEETLGQDEIDGRRPEPPRDGGRRYSSGGLAPLEGAPVIKGATGPDPAIVAVAEQYAADNGIDLRRQARYANVDPDLAMRIAAAYDAMPHAPNDPAVRAAYEDLARQTRLQYDALVRAGYVFTFYDDNTDPYAGNPAAAVRDLRTNKSMAVYGTYAGFGTEGVPDNAVETNAMLADTGLQWPDQNGVMQKVTSNDLFRAVHDAFGHSLEGAGFRARGEENAWQAHIRLYTGAARGAITSETRGQNSWLNYGPNGKQNATASVQDTVFAPNKTGLMPEWTWTEGVVEDMPAPPEAVAEGAETLGAGFEGGRRGQYNIAQQRIELSPNSDFSTFLHELGHHFLEVNNKIALDLLDRQKRGEMLTTRQQQHLDDMRLLLNEAIKRSGIEPGEALPEGVVFQARQEGYLGQDPIEAQEWLRAKAKGLDMSPEGRMKRAKAMGYDTDTVLYHGTSGDVKAFGRDTYLASDRRYSEDWIEGAQDGQIKEVYIKGRKYSADEEETQLVFSDIQILTQEEQQARRRLLRNIENEEYDYVYSPINGGETLVFDPSNIRSIHAAFDPDFADSPNLLAQTETDIGLASLAERALEQGTRKNGVAQSWINDLKKAGVSPEMINYILGPDFAKRQGNIGIEEVRALVSEGKLQLQRKDFKPKIDFGLLKFASNVLEAISFVSPSFRTALENLIDKIDDIVTEPLVTREAAAYKPYALRGGSDYRESVYTIAKGLGSKFADPHFPTEKGNLMHSRSQRWSVGRVVEEMQSFAHQVGAKKGYQSIASKDKPETGTPLSKTWLSALVALEVNRAAKEGERGVWFVGPEIQNGEFVENPPRGAVQAYGERVPAALQALSQRYGIPLEQRTITVKTLEDGLQEIFGTLKQKTKTRKITVIGFNLTPKTKRAILGGGPAVLAQEGIEQSQTLAQTRLTMRTPEEAKKFVDEAVVSLGDGDYYFRTSDGVVEVHLSPIYQPRSESVEIQYWFTSASGIRNDLPLSESIRIMRRIHAIVKAHAASHGPRSYKFIGISESRDRLNEAMLTRDPPEGYKLSERRDRFGQFILVRQPDAPAPTKTDIGLVADAVLNMADYNAAINGQERQDAFIVAITRDMLLYQEGDDEAAPTTPGPRPDQDPLEWFASLPFEQRRPIHEAFARMAETYFATGEAPTPRLKSLFEQFKEFMLKTYNDIQSFLGAPLSDEVRQAMDRFFIARTNVQRAEEGLGFTPAFATKPAFMSQQEWEGYQELTAQATREANGDLSARLMRDMQWLSGAKSREMRRLQRQHAAERRAIREEVTAEVADKQVNRARRFIARGIGQDGQVIPGPHKLSKAALQAQFPEVDLRALGFGQYGLVAEQGLDPDTLASMLGYQNGEALLNDLLTAPKQADEIKAETDSRMLERYGETTSREALERAANEAVHSQLRGRAIHAQHMALAKAVGSRSLLRENAKAAAKIIVGRQPASKLSPKQAMAAERLAARRLMTALKADDLTAAATASRDQVLAFEITAETFRAQKAYQDALRLFRRVNTGKKENVAKNRNYDLVQAARAILSVYGAGTKVDAPMAYIKDIKKYDPALFASLEPLIDDAIGAQKPLKDLSVREVEGLRDVIDQLYTLSREEMKLEIANRQIELQDAVDSLTQRLQDIGAPPPAPPSRAATEGEKRARELQGLGNWLRRVESWARAVDGGVGPFTRLIWRPVSQAADAYRNARNDYIERFRALFTGIEGSLRTGRQIEAPELGYTFIGGKAELLHAILHTGNESNKRKLLLGMGWGRLMPDGETVDDSRWRSFMDRMHREGVITQADYDFAQSVWDLLEEIKPLAQKAHRAVFGRFFSEITAQTVSTPFGDYRGGYVPAIYDPMRSQDAAQRRQQEDIIESNDSQMFPAPASGFTKSRADYSAPMLLDLKLLTTHIDKVLMFSYLAAPVRGVLRILKQKEFSNALAAYDPTAQTDMLEPWLQRSARQIVEPPTTGWGGKMIDAGFRYIRRNSGMGLMMANLVNVLQQVTGFSLAAVMVKPHRLASALVRYTLNPMGTTDAVRAASAMMRERGDNQAAALFGEVTAIIDPNNKIKQLHNWFARHAYFMQVGLQNVMDVIVWQGAYSQAIAEGETHAEAVARGDSAVRLTQTSSLPEDIARAEGGNAGLRVFTHMYNYFNMWGNTLSTEYQIAVRDMGLRKGAGRLVFLYIAGFAIPALIGQLIADVMRGQLPEDDEDDGYLDEWLQYFFGVQAKTALAFAPIVGQVGVATMNVFNEKPYDDRIGGAPSISIIESAVRAPNSVYKAIVEEGDKSRAAKDFLTLLTLATNIPFTVLSRPIGYAIDVAEGDVEPTDELDYARGLVTGSASEASKQ